MSFRYVSTLCPFCSTGCSFNLAVQDGAVVAGAPYHRSPVNDGKTCPKGHYAYEMTTGSERIYTPLIRKDGVLTECSWEEALARVTTQCKEYAGPEIAVIASAHATNEDIYALKRLAEILGTDNFTSPAAVGIDAAAGSISDIANADSVVVVGNLALSHPLAARRVANAKDRGAKVTVVDTYLSPTARLADIFIRAVPGNESEAIAKAAECIEGENAYVLFGVSAGDAEASAAAAALNIAEEKKAVFFAFPAQSNGRGALDMGASTPVKAVLADEKIKCCYIMGEEMGPVSADFVVVQDAFLTVTAQNADVVLPAAVFAETEGTATNAERRVQRLHQAQEPAGGTKPHWKIVADVAAALGTPLGYETPEAIFADLTANIRGYDGLTYEALEKDGCLIPPRKASVAVGLPPLPVKTSDEFPLVLSMVPDIWHGFGTAGTFSKNCPTLVRESPGIRIGISSEDAEKYAVTDGRNVTITSDTGEMTAAVKVMEGITAGTAVIPAMRMGDICACAVTGGRKNCAVRIEEVD
ncbi:molybdopterin-dependent oxidoreductase [Methanogenium sp. S4BF]|uniref:molybdopterin oxidoreductase family protein n=1 Tax=Methanogenium sp. S4BF TaxID=1789226 RepID=UPI002415CBB5|nr:molybdopterin-dependent oxidoreductase [Methanogenium sp. S4BF]WFN33626.1 molybdopterin-dependent oxidoreductase [Methanogenium sp. S4BF]